MSTVELPNSDARGKAKRAVAVVIQKPVVYIGSQIYISYGIIIKQLLKMSGGIYWVKGGIRSLFPTK